MMKIVTKPWGKEEWLELNEKYCYKRIYINAGYKTSYQYHNFKRETNYIISGEAEIWLENDNGVVEKKIMKAGEYFNVTPPKKHRVIALTDIILQEVSTPEVDDVIRIEDDAHRPDGKIESEHKNPAVLILSAGLGTRLGKLTKNINKALIPIDNRAVISHIIEKFPKDYDFVITKGYKGDIIEEYCKITYPERNFSFVEIDNIAEQNSGPGYSTLQCKSLLQRPFYIITCDCLVVDKIPYLDGNWLGVYQTSYPEKYSTVELNDNNEIISFTNKNINGNDFAFIGVASIFDFDIFWKELEQNIDNGELVSAFKNIKKYPNIRAKKLKWFDTGNLDDLNTAKIFFKETPLSLSKDTDEITYKENNLFIKFIPNQKILENKYKRALELNKLIPENCKISNYFLTYNWVDGNTLYSLNDVEIYSKFLEFYNELLNNVEFTKTDNQKIIKFYKDKTINRINLFVQKYGNDYKNNDYYINEKLYKNLNTLLDNFDFSIFYNNDFYYKFHGDLQFDNIVYNKYRDEFKYIDWRESFADDVECGDLYYDLAKMYGGILIPYNLMKDEKNINLVEGSEFIKYDFVKPENLSKFENNFIKFINEKGFDLNKIRLITGLIFLNMSPLHDEKFGKLLWFSGIKILNEYVN